MPKKINKPIILESEAASSIEVYQEVASLVILGQPPRKSNSRRIVNPSGNRPMLIKSQNALDYVHSFSIQVKSQYLGEPLGGINQPLRVDFVIYYASRRPDLSAELIQDCLESAGIISNDRFIRESHLWGFVDKDNPRTHIKIYYIHGERTPPF